MNIEIKVRGLDPINKIVFYPTGNRDATTGHLIDKFTTYMFWIGMKDRKGVDIYEGDIIQISTAYS